MRSQNDKFQKKMQTVMVQAAPNDGEHEQEKGSLPKIEEKPPRVPLA